MRMRGYESAHGGPKAGPPAASALALAQAPALAPVPAVAPAPTTTPKQPAFSTSAASISPVVPQAPNNIIHSKASPKHYKKGGVPAPNPAAREAMRPPKYGGYSKRDQLGSVNDSWGAEESADDGVRRLGLFQIEPEPPSPPATPFP